MDDDKVSVEPIKCGARHPNNAIVKARYALISIL